MVPQVLSFLESILYANPHENNAFPRPFVPLPVRLRLHAKK
jgi:hypothetical protein